MALAAIGAGLTLAGKGAGAAGGVEANKARAKQRADLLATAKKVGGLETPFKESLLAGFEPGGFLRESLAAPGLTRAQQASIDALAEARGIGTRTSAAAQSKTFDAMTQKILESAGIVGEADIRSASAAGGIGLDEFGFSDVFNVQPIKNPFAFAAGAAEGLGSTLASLEDSEGNVSLSNVEV